MIESWHKRLQTKINRKSSLLSFINKLRKESIHYDYEIKKSEVYYDMKKRPSILYDEGLKNIINDFVNDKINVIQCLKRITRLRWIQYNKYDV